MRLDRTMACFTLGLSLSLPGWADPPGGLAPSAASAEAAFRAGDFATAGPLYEQVLAADPDQAQALKGLARIRLYEEHRQAAKDLARRGLAAHAQDRDLQRVIQVADARDAAFAEPNFRVRDPQRDYRIPFLATDPLPLLRARLNGTQDVLLLLDTGAGTLIIDPEVAAKLGLPLQDAGKGTFAGGRQAGLQRTRVDAIDLGELHVTGVDAHVLPTHGFRLGMGTVDGIIGTSFLMHFLATIDYPGGALELRPRAASASVQAAARQRGASVVPMWFIGDHFLMVRGQINDTGPLLMNLDTGLAGGGVQATRAVLESAHVRIDESRAGTGVGGGGATRIIPFEADVAVGGYRVRGLRGLFTPDGDQFGIFPFQVGALVSHEFFRRTRLTLDFEAMRAVIDP
jgi:tetratricopeptide (TPR) repeat protein